MSVCMVCLSFEQSVLTKQKNKTKQKNRGGGVGGRVGKGWFIRKNHVVGNFVLFRPCLVSVRGGGGGAGGLHRDSRSCARRRPQRPARLPKRPLVQACRPDGRAQSRAMTPGTQMLCAPYSASETRVCVASLPWRVWCGPRAHVYLKRTENCRV